MKNKPEFQQIELDPTFPVSCMTMHTIPNVDLFYCHWHPNIEIIYVDKGDISMRIDTQNFELAKGDICIINPNQVHYGISKEGSDCSVRLIILFYDILSQNPEDTIYQKYIEPLNSGRLLLPSVIPRINKNDTPLWLTECHLTVQTLLNFGDQQFEGKELGIQSAFLMLLTTLYRYNKLVGASAIKKASISKREMEILTYLENHFTEAISIPKLASIFEVSEDYFYKLFKKTTGQTPINYILQLRIRYAQQLLKTTSYSISEIGYQVGCESTSYFSKTFKKLTGFSSREYRKHL